MKDLHKKEQFLNQIKKRELNLAGLPFSLQQDIEVIVLALEYHSSFEFVAPEFRNNIQVACAAIKQPWWRANLTLISESIYDNPEFMLASLKNVILPSWGKMSEEMKNDEKFFKQALHIRPESYQFASEKLKKDKAFSLNALKRDGDVFVHLPSYLKEDLELVMVAIKSRPKVLKLMSESIKDNKEVVMNAIKAKGDVLQYASERLRDDEEVVIRAIKNSSPSFSFASDRIKDNKEIAQLAIDLRLSSLCHASENLRNDLEFIFKQVKKDSKAFEYCGKHLKSKISNHQEPLIEMEKMILDSRLNENNNTQKKMKI
jgi:hypothetical protein